jgi:hypothetical protein
MAVIKAKKSGLSPGVPTTNVSNSAFKQLPTAKP